jgi:LPXTG-motif cell wall-anchored protein
MEHGGGTMKKLLLAAALAMTIGVLLIAGAHPLRAEDSGVFKNSADISRAQEILVGDGTLASGSFTPGSLDAATRRALTAYQTVHAINESGDLDDETYQSLTSHETSYPWGAETAMAGAPAQPVEPAAAPSARTAEAPAMPEPIPSPVEVKQAPIPAAPQPARKMPATGSSLPLLALAGLALLGGGALLLRQHAG